MNLKSVMKSQMQKATYYIIPFIKMFKIRNSIEKVHYYLSVGEGQGWGICTDGYGVSCWSDDNVLELRGTNGYTTLRMY